MAKYGLCIGINDYPGSNNDLQGCVNDVKDWSAELTRRGFQVKTLLDKYATLKAMRNSLSELVSKGKSGDSLVFQYSGHGSFVPDEDGDEPDGTDECLCPWDIDTQGPFIDDEIFYLMNQVAKGVKFVFISDSCHSGTVVRFASFGKKKADPCAARVKFLPPSSFMPRKAFKAIGPRRMNFKKGIDKLLLSKTPALLMSGCQDTEYSYDAFFTKNNGAFTYNSLLVLKSLPASATYFDWYKAIRKVMPSRQYPQTPNMVCSADQSNWKIFS